MNRVRVLVANVAAIVSGKAVAALAGLATIMLMTRHLGPQEFGYYRTVLTFIGFAAVLADSGIYMVALREMSRPEGDKARIAGTAMPWRLVSSVTVLALACLLAQTFPYDPIVKWGVWIGAGIWTCIQAAELLVAVFQSVQKQGRNAIAESLGALATLAGAAVLISFHAGALGMLAATLFGSLLALAVSWRLARQLVAFRLRCDLRAWGNYIVLGLPMAGAQIVGMAILRGDSLVLSVFQPAAAVGLYGVSTKLFELATSLAYMFGGVMMPTLTAAATRNGEDFPKVLGHTVDTAVIYGIGSILALAPFAPQVLTLVAGPEFAVGAPALAVISFAIALAAISHVLRFALVACEQSRLVFQADALACAVGFAAYFLLIPRYSLLGAAVGTVIAETFSLLGMLRGLRRAGHGLPSPVNLLKAVGAGLVAGAAMFASDQLDAPWVLSLLLGAVVYLVVLALTRAIPRELVAAVLHRGESYQRSA